MLSPPILIAGVALLTLLGAFALRRGMRGRPIDDHPVCAACAFDLIGVYPGAAGCPECGAPLDGPRAVRTGNRPRRPRLIALGTVLLVGALFLGGFGAVSTFGGSRWRSMAPVWYLRSELSSVKSGDDAMKELIARQSAKKLSAGQISAIADDVLARQANMNLAWPMTWGDFFETARAANQLLPEQIASYVRHAPVISFSGRTRVEQNGEWPYELTVGPNRTGSGNSLISVHAELKSVKIGESEFAPAGRGGMTSGVGARGWASTSSRVALKGLAAGTHEAKVTWHITGFDSPGGRGREVATWDAEFPATIKVVASGSDAVELVTDAQTRDAMKGSIRVQQLTLNGTQVEGYVYLDSTPVAVAFDIYWRLPPGEGSDTPRDFKIGSITGPATAAGVSHGSNFNGQLPAGLSPKTVDVILKPNPGAAKGTTNLNRIWGEEIVIKEVPVTVMTPDPEPK